MLREIFRKWWWVVLLVVTVFYIWVRYFTETTKPAEPAWPSGKPKAATEAEIAAKAKSFADFKAAAEAKAKAADKKPLTKEESAKVIEAAIREQLEKPTGELTKADLEKVTKLHLGDNQLTDVTGLEKLTQLKKLNLGLNKLTDVKSLEKLTQLKELWLRDNPSLTKAQIDELQKAFPKCKIVHNATK